MPTVKLHLWTLDPTDGYEMDLPAGWPVPRIGEHIQIAEHGHGFVVSEVGHMLDTDTILIYADDERKAKV